MKRNVRLFIPIILFAAFIAWSVLLMICDRRSVGAEGTEVGLASLNLYFHSLTGVNMTLYKLGDFLSVIPIGVAFGFALLGFVQLISRKSLLAVDKSLYLLGGFFLVVFLFYLLFEFIPINYRPILINGIAEASYPSSTTLLVLSVMPTLVFLTRRRIKNGSVRVIIRVATILFSCFMVLGRLISGVHWLTDIIGGILLQSFYDIGRKNSGIANPRKKGESEELS